MQQRINEQLPDGDAGVVIVQGEAIRLAGRGGFASTFQAWAVPAQKRSAKTRKASSRCRPIWICKPAEGVAFAGRLL